MRFLGASAWSTRFFTFRKKSARWAGSRPKSRSQTSRLGQPGLISMGGKARPKHADQGRHAFGHFRHNAILDRMLRT